MRKLTVFNSVSVDGYFRSRTPKSTGRTVGRWILPSRALSDRTPACGGELLFGRMFFQIMESYWPTPAATAAFPVVAAGMNAIAKTVFSRALAETTRTKTRLIGNDMVAEVKA